MSQAYKNLAVISGNAGADGPFIELGFRPSVVLLKNSTGSANNWMIIDQREARLMLLMSYCLQVQVVVRTQELWIDFLSNGFKVRDNSGGFNESSQTIVYAAWAEAPTIDLYGGGASAR